MKDCNSGENLLGMKLPPSRFRALHCNDPSLPGALARGIAPRRGTIAVCPLVFA